MALKQFLIYILILLNIALLTTRAMAEEACEDSSLNSTLSSLQDIPIWNQDQSNLCYAFSAAILIDNSIAKNRTQPLELFTSPLALAAQTVVYASDKSIRTTFWGGNIQQSLTIATLEGSCSAGWMSDQLGSEKLTTTISTLRSFQKRAAKKDLQTQTQVAQEILSYLAELGGDQESLPSIASLLLMFTQKQDRFMGSLLSSLCQTKNDFPLPEPKEMKKGSYHSTGISLTTQLNTLLAINSTPVAIEFCSDVVNNPNFATAYNTPCSRHYAVAVGQRKIKGTCEVLMRDSLCEFYNSVQKDRCSNGHYWIKRRDLMAHAHSLNWL